VPPASDTSAFSHEEAAEKLRESAAETCQAWNFCRNALLRIDQAGRQNGSRSRSQVGNSPRQLTIGTTAGGGRGAGVEPSPRAPWYPDGPGRTWFVSGGSGRPGSPLGPMDQAQVPRSGRILAGHTDAASAPNLSLRRAAGTPSHQALRCGPPARTPFASGPRPFELAANPADPPSTGWHSRPHLSAAPVPQGVCRKGRIGPKSNF
jgi:hypothetical protein